MIVHRNSNHSERPSMISGSSASRRTTSIRLLASIPALTSRNLRSSLSINYENCVLPLRMMLSIEHINCETIIALPTEYAIICERNVASSIQKREPKRLGSEMIMAVYACRVNSKTVAPIRHTCGNGKTLFTRAGECEVNISGDPDYKYQAVPRNPISFIVLRQMNAAEDPFSCHVVVPKPPSDSSGARKTLDPGPRC